MFYACQIKRVMKWLGWIIEIFFTVTAPVGDLFKLKQSMFLTFCGGTNKYSKAKTKLVWLLFTLSQKLLQRRLGWLVKCWLKTVVCTPFSTVARSLKSCALLICSSRDNILLPPPPQNICLYQQKHNSAFLIILFWHAQHLVKVWKHCGLGKIQ